MKKLNLIGERFERLVVIERVGSNGKQSLWRCLCDCGNEKIVTTSHLKQGCVKSCGCLTKEIASLRGHLSKIGERSRKHGDFGTKLYGVWAAMISRCENHNQRYYKDYGGRGIKVCDEWRYDYSKFKGWALSNGYEEGLTIDRINNDGNYEPSNCRWATKTEQMRNRRNTIKIEHNGKFYTLREIADLYGLKPRTVIGRYERGERTFEQLARSLK